MDYLTTLHISGTGLTAQRTRLNIISQNLANMDTTRTEKGGAYKRKILVMEEASVDDLDAATTSDPGEGGGVRVSDVVEDTSPCRQIYNPDHPDANESGFVELPNVDPIVEMANMVIAKRSYEANVAAIGVTKAMAVKALEIGK